MFSWFGSKSNTAETVTGNSVFYTDIGSGVLPEQAGGRTAMLPPRAPRASSLINCFADIGCGAPPLYAPSDSVREAIARSGSHYLHMTSSDVLAGLRDHGVVAEPRLRRWALPFEPGLSNAAAPDVADARGMLKVFIPVGSFENSGLSFSSMDIAGFGDPFPVVTGIGGDYPVSVRGAGITVSGAVIRDEHIGVIFAPQGRVNDARALLGQRTIGVTEWPKAFVPARDGGLAHAARVKNRAESLLGPMVEDFL